MLHFLLSFDFCWTFGAIHTPQLSLELFLVDQMPMKTIQLENSQAQVNSELFLFDIVMLTDGSQYTYS